MEETLTSILMSLLLAGPAGANPYSLQATAVVQQDVDPFEWEASVSELRAGSEAVVELRLVVPDGFVVYRDQLEVIVLESDGLIVGEPDLPPALKRKDPADGADLRELYDSDVVVHVPVSAPGRAPGLARLVVQLRHQGCRDPPLLSAHHAAEGRVRAREGTGHREQR